MDFTIRFLQITCENFPPACITNFSILGGVLLPAIYAVAAFTMLGFLIKGALKFMRSQGDATKMQEARQTMSFTILGIIVVFVAYFIVRVLAYALDIPFPL